MLIATLLFAVTAAAAPASRLVVHEKRSAPEHFKRQRLDADAVIPIRIALTQSNLEDGYAYLMDVSDPDSANYGKHWTTEEIHAKFSPSDHAIETVTAWLEEAGFHRDSIAESTSRGWLAVDMPVHKAESLFGAEYYGHEDESGDTRVGCDIYHIPAHLSGHIDHLRPGIVHSAPLRKTKSKRAQPLAFRDTSDSGDKIPYISPTSLDTCGEYITPACLKALYGIPDATLNQPENKLGVFELGDYYDQPDLDLYFSNYAPWVPNGTHPTQVSINGAEGVVPVTSKKIGGESVVDFQLALSLLYPQDVTLYQVQPTKKQNKALLQKYGKVFGGDMEYFQPFLDAIDGSFCTKLDRDAGADCGTIELTKVLSVSYGINELQLPEAAAKRYCAEFMKLALKGHTILTGSGDYGPGGHPALALGLSDEPNTACFDPKHPDSLTRNGTIFNPQFPSSCPFIVSVGGTQMNSEDKIGDPERALHIINKAETPYPDVYAFGTSGGISNYFPLPEYQRCVVDDYFKNHDPGYPTYEYTGIDSIGANGGIYARGGRATPDVAVNGAHLACFLFGEFYPAHGETGTSLSTPIFASMITLINQQRTLAGKGPVGFINPVIYKHPELFNDITLGHVPGCYTDGFAAVEGWDPTTGLGTPNYPALLELFMSLP